MDTGFTPDGWFTWLYRREEKVSDDKRDYSVDTVKLVVVKKLCEWLTCGSTLYWGVAIGAVISVVRRWGQSHGQFSQGGLHVEALCQRQMQFFLISQFNYIICIWITVALNHNHMIVLSNPNPNVTSVMVYPRTPLYPDCWCTHWGSGLSRPPSAPGACGWWPAPSSDWWRCWARLWPRSAAGCSWWPWRLWPELAWAAGPGSPCLWSQSPCPGSLWSWTVIQYISFISYSALHNYWDSEAFLLLSGFILWKFGFEIKQWQWG